MPAAATRIKSSTLERPPFELEKQIADLKETIEKNENDLARVAAVNLSNNRLGLRNLLDQIHALDIDPKVKREMTEACLHLIALETASKRIGIELTENDAAFLSKLEKKHHGLNPRELRACIFIKLNYDTVEIARFSNITPRGMESIRYRMHKKLGIGLHDSIKTYLSKLAVA